MGIAGYGLLGASVYLNKKAVTDYNNYLTEEDPADSEDLYNRSEENNNLSKILAYQAIGIWTINLVWTALKAKNSKNTVTGSLNKKQRIFFYSGIDPRTKSAGFTIKYRF